MNCDKARDLLWDYADGLIPDEAAEDLEKHLADCPACRDEVARMRITLGALGEFPEVEADPDFRTRLNQLIDAWEGSRRLLVFAAAAAYIRRHRRSFATCAAVFVLSLVGGLLTLEHMTGPSRGPAPAVRVGAADENLPADAQTPDRVPQIEVASDTLSPDYLEGLGQPDEPSVEDYILRPVVKPVSNAGPPF
jgi:anti-sigma factor RsiW